MMLAPLESAGPNSSRIHDVNARPTTTHQRVGQWIMDVVTDPFAGTTHCRLRAPRMAYDQDALTFSFSAGIDTFGALYKIDNGPALSWRVNAMTMASKGVALQQENLSNPSAGRVSLPLSALAGVHTVTIRPTATAQAVAFKIDDLPLALAAAQAAGCSLKSEDPE